MRAFIVVIFIALMGLANAKPVANFLQAETHIVTNTIKIVNHGFKGEQSLEVGTVIKRAVGADPKWWSGGVAIMVPFKDGEEQGWKLAYTSKQNWEAGFREKRVTEFIDPAKAFKAVEEVVSAPTTEDGCIPTEAALEKAPTLYSNEREAELMSKVIPTEQTYNELMAIVDSAISGSECRRNVRKYLNHNSPWSKLTPKERAELMDIKSKKVMTSIKEHGKELELQNNFSQFRRECTDKIRHFEAERIKVLTKSSADHSVGTKLNNYTRKVGNKNNRIWVESIDELYAEVEGNISESISEKILANTNYDQTTKEDVKTQLAKLSLPSSPDILKAIKKRYPGYSNLPANKVRNFIVDKITESYIPYITEHTSKVRDELDMMFVREDLPGIVKGVKKHGQFCFQMVGELYNQTKTSLPLEAINGLEPVLTPGLPMRKKLATKNPHIFSDKLNASVAMCIARTETKVDKLNPNSINYTYCGNVGTKRGARRYNPSTAQGFDHTVVSTIHSLRKAGQLPLISLDEENLNPMNYNDNRRINQIKANNVEAQFETSFRHMNYLLKRGHTKKTRAKVLSGKIPADLEVAVIHYDQDNESDYLKGFIKCYNCLETDVPNGSASVSGCMGYK